MKITEKKIRELLTDVMDPELNISIVDLGLLYKIAVEKETIKITMTLTTIGCPLFNIIEQEIKNKLSIQNINADQVKIDLTFDPPWTMEKMSEKAKAMLGI